MSLSFCSLMHKKGLVYSVYLVRQALMYEHYAYILVYCWVLEDICKNSDVLAAAACHKINIW